MEKEKRFIALLGRPFFIFLFQDFFRIRPVFFLLFQIGDCCRHWGGKTQPNRSVSRGSVVVCTETFAQFEIKSKKK
jgi:hypothetical protein